MPVCPTGHDSVATDFCDTCGMRIQGAPSAPASSASGSGTGGSGTGGSGTGGSGANATAAFPAGAGVREPGESCPQCGTERTGLFCEGCGYDYRTGAPVSPAGPASSAGSGYASGSAYPPGSSYPSGSAHPSGSSYPADPSYPYGPPGQVGVTPAASTVTPHGSATPGTGPQYAPSSATPGPAWTAVVTADRSYFDRVIAAGGPDAAAIKFPPYCPERRFALSGREMRVGRRSTSRGLEPEIDLTGPPTDPGISHLHAVLVPRPGGGWSVLDPGSSNGTQVNGNDIEIGVPVPLQSGDRICIGAWTVLTIQA
jgi:hypothetical protein